MTMICIEYGSTITPSYSSGQRGLTVNQLALAFGGSNPSLGTSNHHKTPDDDRGFYLCFSYI